MVGVGTAKADLVNARTTFCSLLGSDRESWGFSYHGQIQHNGIKQNYAVEFQGGNLVGVHLDTWKGTLEFYLNRKPLGKMIIDYRICHYHKYLIVFPNRRCFYRVEEFRIVSYG